ncbi:hypothetical protein [Gallaecimonas xiamenensis]|uniref:Rap1a immunity protein domain-containing protein n=1 Tax=Gallaecimonas xiamenensis 3-C-1 TaxID=745411 RepID=K2IZH3_9GAMM|nr:hypothetical protein [Gallaecimonas xiamenensis]EKE68283.1 hypothetical protein B3C1_17287 [Gallaecimonas xiamenensis 3-C-1]
MKVLLIPAMLLAMPALAEHNTQPLSHFDEFCLADGPEQERCRDYLLGVVDGVKMLNDNKGADGSGYLDRVKAQRIGGRLDYMRSRLCDNKNPDKDKLLVELRTEIDQAGIQSEQDLLHYLNKAFSCQ